MNQYHLQARQAPVGGVSLGCPPPLVGWRRTRFIRVPVSALPLCLPLGPMLSLHRHAARASARSALFSSAAAAAAAVETEAGNVLQVDLRQVEGSRAARRLRKQGLLPGVLYGEGEDGDASKVLVALQTRAFEKLHRKLWSSVENQVFDVQVGDAAPVKACMRDVQFDPGAFLASIMCWLW